MQTLFFDGWWPLARTLIAGSLSYAALILMLRIAGKRTLSKWNAFDYVVTVALGSTLATLLLSKETTIVQGAVALLLLIGLQFIVTWLSVRSRSVSRAVKAQPTLLLRNGQFCREAMKNVRVTETEILAAVRNQGIANLERVAAVVLETDGSFSVIADVDDATASALTDVVGYRD